MLKEHGYFYLKDGSKSTDPNNSPKKSKRKRKVLRPIQSS
jgi:hypothetical protein